MELLEGLKWRYATKKFDASKKISTEDLEMLKEAISLTPTSYGLELYKVLLVENEEIRAQLKEAAWGQSQVTDASHVFVFCNYADVQESDIDAYLNRKATASGIQVADLKGYGDFMKKTVVHGMDAEMKGHWTTRQTYIALSNLMDACAELKIDSCPMEGFDNAQFNKILGLEEKGLNAAVVATVGYRAEDDATQHQPKVRKPLDELFETV